MGKKKPFIDRKTAQHFHVVHRSQRDTDRYDPDASEFVLLPSTNGNQKQQKSDSGLTGKVNELGIVDDNYDYTQHLKEIGHGTFYTSSGDFKTSAGDILARKIELPKDAIPAPEETERMLNAITLSTEDMDPDLSEALVNTDCFDALQDSFVVEATAESGFDDASDEFDYDAHISKLLGRLNDNKKERKYIAATDMPNVGTEPTDDIVLLDEMFDRTLEEYDDSNIGELDEDSDEAHGQIELTGNLLTELMEDYVTMKQEFFDDTGVVGNPRRTGNELERFRQECEDNMKEVDTDLEMEDEDVDDDISMAFAEYLAVTKTEKWDCESIVSTYSNFDNRPTVIAAPKSRKPHRPLIRISQKSGLPFTANEERKPKNEESMSVVITKARDRDETTDARRERKNQVKEEKRKRRAEKKATKLAFQHEQQRQHMLGSGQCNTSVSTFRY